MKTTTTITGLAVALLVLSACSGTGQDEGPAEGESLDLSIAVVTHGAPDDAFWSVVKAGSDRAAEDLGIEAPYNSSEDVTAQAELIDTAVADEVDGIVVSMANPEGLQGSVEAAVEAGIPVVTIHSGVDQSAQFGAITHVGQSEGIAGEAAGEEFNRLGATKLLCVIHEAGNVGLTERCDGAEEAFDGDVETLQVDGAETTTAAETISSALQSDDSIDAVLALNGQAALGSTQAVEQVGTEVLTGTFDLSSDVLVAVEDGGISFAVDQQPYVQGYLGVQFLYLRAINGNDVGGGQPVYSGPALVTQENAAEVAEFVDQGTR